MVLTRLFPLMLFLTLSIGAGSEGPWWGFIPEGLRIIFSLTLFLVNLFVLAAVLYVAGLIVVGAKRALLGEAFLISLLGTVLSTLFLVFISYRWVALALSVIVWLLLIKHLYETGWLGAIAVSILTVMIFLAIAVILALFFGIAEGLRELLSPCLILLFRSV
jgi:hypothetical protein